MTLSFGERLLAWHERNGRKDLPWQRDRSLYRVWISEIMLQQTQVATVIGYYERFMTRFPTLLALADAPLDQVLHLWSGLGYYARARNLHRAAVRIRDQFAGEFPTAYADLRGLPGIGRSTAGAILALAGHGRYPILDGNVKRVMARYFGIAGDPGLRAVDDQLWARSDACTPAERVDVYTQAIMDLGAMLCVRSRPRCVLCPLSDACTARITGRQAEFPSPKRRVRQHLRRMRRTVMLVARHETGTVLLEKRPLHGIWGGLWCLPEFGSESAARSYALQYLAAPQLFAGPLREIPHRFTHFDLVIAPLLVDCRGPSRVMEGGDTLWYNARDPAAIGLPAPVQGLLEALAGTALTKELL
jgi:A/G-specific adenine glycosylase